MNKIFICLLYLHRDTFHEAKCFLSSLFWQVKPEVILTQCTCFPLLPKPTGLIGQFSNGTRHYARELLLNRLALHREKNQPALWVLPHTDNLVLYGEKIKKNKKIKKCRVRLKIQNYIKLKLYSNRLKFRTYIANKPRKTHGKCQFFYSSIFTKKAVIKNPYINPSYESHINGAWATCGMNFICWRSFRVISWAKKSSEWSENH
jgi:hypothetical protein